MKGEVELSSAMAGTEGRREIFGVYGLMCPVFYYCFELHFYFQGFTIWKISVICVISKSSFIFFPYKQDFFFLLPWFVDASVFSLFSAMLEVELHRMSKSP